MKAGLQRGMSSLGLLGVLAVGGFGLLIGFKVGPLYLDNYFVSSALDLLEEVKVHEMTDHAIKRKLASAFIVNNVRDIDMKDVKVIREKTRTLVTVNYEKRIEFLGNVDVVVKFDNVYDSSKT